MNECDHEWVHLRSDHLRVMVNGVWKQDMYNKNVEYMYDIFFCRKCLMHTKVLYSDDYGSKPLERENQ